MIPLADQIFNALDGAAGLYHRLILVVGPAGAGKTAALQKVSAGIGAPIVNVNLELSRRMLDLTERQRILQLPRLLGTLVDDAKSDVVLLDNIEVLFDVALKQDALRLLQGISRSKTIVAAWNGAVKDEHVTYATPDHHEYRRYPIKDLLVLTSD